MGAILLFVLVLLLCTRGKKKTTKRRRRPLSYKSDWEKTCDEGGMFFGW